MSELLLLAAGLLSRANAGSLPTANLLPVLPPPADAAGVSGAKAAVVPVQAATDQVVQPEFSQSSQQASAENLRTAETGGAWTGRRRSLQRTALAQTAAAQPVTAQPSTPAHSFNTLQTAAAQNAAAQRDGSQARPSQASAVRSITAGRSPVQVAAASSPAPVPTLTDIPPARRIRPQSGAQQYQQRWAALRQGQTYTRIATDSFAEQWINATEQPTYEQWVTLLGYEARAMAAGQGNNRLSVLVGDSISQWFPVEQLSRDRFWLNQGISGDTTAGVLRRLSLFQDTRPADIHVMVGINDLRRGASNAEVLNNLSQIMQDLRQTHPQARIWIYSILPTRLPALPPERIFALNQNLEAIARQQQVAYVDLQRFFAEEPSGILRRDLTTDGIHLSRTGYALWQWAIGYLI
ncbi:GDSL-type esterase/lipase family protein [Leptolyngbya sp. O-77]|uniref:GDSL-type esterase/lipase family protein n=1 Tax=Leptolyngbya sp. O-77 TaxID=1080068 RepID=UPI00074D3903|nr:GDSL-type esterase/lipase family protein [Leptolyngbya sp. O-77]BAU42299.1 Esterase TesA precursor [Leptolyngbya sp. O-77]